MKLKYIPNILSVIRIILVFVFVAVFFRYPDTPSIAVAVFVIGGITDVIDGRLARHYGWVTQFGKILDPLADKLMQCTALLCLAIGGYVPLWIFIFFLVKELTMGLGSIIFFRRAGEIGVSRYFGKAAVVFFYTIVGAIILFGRYISKFWVNVMCISIAAFAVLVLVLYYINYMSNKARKKNNSKADPESVGGEADLK